MRQFRTPRIVVLTHDKPGKLPLVSVTDTRVVDTPLDLAAQGHVVALDFVDVRPQVSGTVVSVAFHEGDQVAKGQQPFTVDDSDARAQLTKADAQIGLVQAQLADARREHDRARALVQAKFMAVRTVDAAASKVDGLEAQLRAARAEAVSAGNTLARTRIVAPIAGRAGAKGQLSFINNTVNPDSATINLKASFPNLGQTLWPGGFARVVVHAGVSRGAVVLPPPAVQEGPGGRFVYLLGPDNKVSSRPVTLLRIQDEAAVVEASAAAGVIVATVNGRPVRLDEVATEPLPIPALYSRPNCATRPRGRNGRTGTAGVPGRYPGLQNWACGR
jgi:multidrug efflux pump subunit AcrA (membrane-fusion protein)